LSEAAYEAVMEIVTLYLKLLTPLLFVLLCFNHIQDEPLFFAHQYENPQPLTLQWCALIPLKKADHL
jgi:hypothetical protein